MFDGLEDVKRRYEEVMSTLSSPGVTDDQKKYMALMKEQSELAPVVEAYDAYCRAGRDIEDSLQMLESESDEDMREMRQKHDDDMRGLRADIGNLGNSFRTMNVTVIVGIAAMIIAILLK